MIHILGLHNLKRTNFTQIKYAIQSFLLISRAYRPNIMLKLVDYLWLSHYYSTALNDKETSHGKSS